MGGDDPCWTGETRVVSVVGGRCALDASQYSGKVCTDWWRSGQAPNQFRSGYSFGGFGALVPMILTPIGESGLVRGGLAIR